MNLKVELRLHTGKQQTPIGVVDIEHNQWIVMAGIDGQPLRQVGYLGKHEGAHVAATVDLPAPVWAAITKECEKLKGSAVSSVAELARMKDEDNTDGQE